MKRKAIILKSVSWLLAGSILTASCTSTTLIQSTPNGAKVYLNGEPVGTTPYTYRDTKITGSTTFVKLEKDGYEPVNTFFGRDEEVDVGAIVGGVFFLVPFLWTMKYKPTHTYELKPLTENSNSTIPPTVPSIQSRTKAERLREVKNLLDEGLINQEDYDKEKKKILEEVE